jgi:hypothetical protein
MSSFSQYTTTRSIELVIFGEFFSFFSLLLMHLFTVNEHVLFARNMPHRQLAPSLATTTRLFRCVVFGKFFFIIIMNLVTNEHIIHSKTNVCHMCPWLASKTDACRLRQTHHIAHQPCHSQLSDTMTHLIKRVVFVLRLDSDLPISSGKRARSGSTRPLCK